MSLTKVASDGIEALAITNAHLHTAANIAHSKLADSGASAGSYGSSTAIPSVTVNAKGIITSVSQTSIDTDLLADTSPQLGGNLDVNTKNRLFGDSDSASDDRLIFGANSDLQIYHSGSHSFVQDVGQGSLKLAGADVQVVNADNTAVLAQFISGGKNEFRFDGNTKLETTNTGISVTGNISVSGNVDGADVAAMNSKLAGIESGATADQTAAEIKTLLNSNQLEAAQLATNSVTRNKISDGEVISSKLDSSAVTTSKINNDAVTYAKIQNVSATNRILGRDSSGAGVIEEITPANLRAMLNVADGATNVTNNNQLTNGAGYITSASLAGVSDGGNAALLDGVDSTSFCRSDQDDTLTGIISLESNAQYPLVIDGNNNGKISLKGSNDPYIRFHEGTTEKGFIQWNDGGYMRIQNQEDGSIFDIRDSIRFSPDAGNNFYSVWHGGNDGASSGLDADLLDGVQGSSYLRSDANDTFSSVLTLSNSGRDCVNFSANSTDDNRGIAFNGRIALSADHNDGYLRINNASEFSNGVYTPLVMRADGGFQVDGNTVINGSGQLIASRLTGALPAIDGSNLTGVGGGVESGTVMLFYQANAPTGWTKQTSQNNKALRVVSGTGGGTGGSNNFTTAFNSSRGTSGGSVSNHTLTTAQMPSHRHKVDTYNEFGNSFGNWTTQGGYRQAHANGTRRPPYTSYEGSGNAHNHGFTNPSLNLNVQYVDVIIAQKD